MSVERFQVQEGGEEAAIEKAKAYRAQEPSFIERERAGAIEATRRQAQSMGTHRAGPDGRFRTEHPVRFQTSQVDAGSAGDGVRVGELVLRRSVAISTGLIGEDGKLTAKGQALAKRADGPAARPAAQPSRVTAEELEHRQGDDLEDTEDDERADTELTGIGSDTADSVDALIGEGNYSAVVDSAAEALGTLDHSEAYSQAVERYLAGENVTGESLAAIGEELGISKVQAAQLVDRVFDGHRAEAAAAVSGILSPSEAASFAEFIVDEPDRFSRAAAKHVQHATTVGWVSEARAFKEAIRALGDLDDLVGEHVGGTVEKQGAQYILRREGHAPMDLRVAAARGLVRPR